MQNPEVIADGTEAGRKLVISKGITKSSAGELFLLEDQARP
jgi:hypothetical protein